MLQDRKFHIINGFPSCSFKCSETISKSDEKAESRLIKIILIWNEVSKIPIERNQSSEQRFTSRSGLHLLSLYPAPRCSPADWHPSTFWFSFHTTVAERFTFQPQSRGASPRRGNQPCRPAQHLRLDTSCSSPVRAAAPRICKDRASKKTHA